jgi:hypothetical protein
VVISDGRLQKTHAKWRAMFLVAAALVGVMAALMLGGAALGKDAGEITVAEGQTVTKEVTTPIPGHEPTTPIPIGGSFFRNPSRCRGDVGVAYCDVITLNIQRPAHYASSDFFYIEVELTWPEANPAAPNNLNLYLHLADGTDFYALSSESNKQPERFRLYDPPANKYYLVVSNRSGVNVGYRLKVSFVKQEGFAFEEVEDSEGAGRSQADRDSPVDDPGFSDFPLAPGPEGTGSVGPRPVERPGPDGSLSRRPLVLLAAVSPPGPNSRLPLIISSAIALLAAAGLGIFFYLRGRLDSDF